MEKYEIDYRVKELRNYERIFKGDRIDGNLSPIFGSAADIIESLSAKLDAANGERAERYYNGGWIPLQGDNDLPMRGQKCLVTVIWEEVRDSGLPKVLEATYDGYGWDIDKRGIKNYVMPVAWMPCPEP